MPRSTAAPHADTGIAVREAERVLRLATASHAPRPSPVGTLDTLPALFAASVARHGGCDAVCDAGVAISYTELDRRSARLASLLVARGVGRGSAIGICMERGAGAYVAILAVLKAGAAYVPLDPRYPLDRVGTIAADCALALLICDAIPAAPGVLPWVPLSALEAEASEPLLHPQPIPEVLPDDLGYIIYTSGSTGRPKGVAITHASAAHFVRAASRVYEVHPEDRVWQGFSLAFDASVEEIWLTLANGACLVSGTQAEVTSGPALAGHLARAGVTVFSCVPTALALLEQDVDSLRLLIVGGEACPPDLAARWCRPGRRMLNTYGPTETTVVATWSELRPGTPVTIGVPLPGYRVLLLDEHLAKAAPGASAQIYIGGPGLARGYLNQPELTAERFIVNPYAAEMPDAPRLYATGDLGSLTDYGEIAFRGRIDGQLKLRGFRIELGEIEAALLAQLGVAAAAATVHERSGGLRDLVAHVVPRDGVGLDRATLAAALRQRLPSHMVPGFIELCDALPLGISGKVDRSRLPAPDTSAAIGSGEYVAPRDDAERAVAAVWARVLGHARVSVTDDFFLDLGGHSLAAAAAISVLRVELDAPSLAVPDLYAHPTVRALAALLPERAARIATSTPSAASPVSRAWHALCGAAQALALYPITLVGLLPLLLPFVAFERFDYSPLAVVLATILSFVVVRPFQMAVAIAAKWALIGRYREGSYPLWGRYYLRWWLAARFEDLVPLHRLAGSPLLNTYARLMGARIGRGVYLGLASPAAWDLLSVGDGASVGDDASLPGYEVVAGRLRFGSLRIGRGAVVGARAAVGIGAAIGDGASLDPLGLLASYTVVPDGSRWGGSPAGPIDLPDPELEALRALPAPPAPRALPYALAAVGIALLPSLAGLAELPLVLWAYRSLSTPWFLLSMAPAAACYVLSLALLLAAVKRTLPVRPGIQTIGSRAHVRRWAADQLLGLALEGLPTLFGTLYAAPWLRLLGARIGSRTEVSTVAHFAPDLVRIGPDCFVADDVHAGAVAVAAGRAALREVHIGRGSFVGNSACLVGGTTLPEDSLIGVLSLAPQDAAPGSSWLGSPALSLPRRQLWTEQAGDRQFAPTRRIRAVRLAIEAARILLPPALNAIAAAAALTWLAWVAGAHGLLLALASAPVAELLLGLAAALLVAAAKWALVGCYRPRVDALWTHFVWRSELATGLYEAVAVPQLLKNLLGTPFIAPYLRLLGAKVGRRAYIGTTNLTEFDLVEIGDEAMLGHDCTVQTHLFEDRVMKMDTLTIGARCAVGAHAVALYGTIMGAGSELGALSLLMKGESFAAGSRWAGIPARADHAHPRGTPQ